LPARHRQLLRQVAQQRIGDADVALGILEVDRIHLVRHGGGADLARLGPLAEVAERDVAPQVAVEVEQHAVGDARSSPSPCRAWWGTPPGRGCATTWAAQRASARVS